MILYIIYIIYTYVTLYILHYIQYILKIYHDKLDFHTADLCDGRKEHVHCIDNVQLASLTKTVNLGGAWNLLKVSCSGKIAM